MVFCVFSRERRVFSMLGGACFPNMACRCVCVCVFVFVFVFVFVLSADAAVFQQEIQVRWKVFVGQVVIDGAAIDKAQKQIMASIFQTDKLMCSDLGAVKA